jgi:hypothetical protein
VEVIQGERERKKERERGGYEMRREKGGIGKGRKDNFKK